jgi:DNA-binding beta-propeller fold protein YncE
MTSRVSKIHGSSFWITCSILIGLLLSPAVSHSSLIMEYERILVAEPPLTRPSAITFTPDVSSVCVTDEASGVLNVFDRQGFHQFKTDGVSGLLSPRGGCIDAEGGFVFTDRNGDFARTIRRLNFLGEPVEYEPELPREGWRPDHLIIGQDGHYITLDPSALLVKHDANTGAIIWKLRLMDPGAEKVDLIGRPAKAPDGRIYIPNSGDRSILVVSSNGKFLSSFGDPGSRRGNLLFPVGVSFDPEGRVLVLDRMRHRILIFDSNHKFMTEFGRLGSGPGEMYHPRAIAASPEGRVWSAQGFKGRVQVFLLRDTGSDPGAPGDKGPAHNNEGENR